MSLNNGKVEIYMIERFVDLTGKRVLEVGCGDGRLTSLLARKSGTLVAIDPDSESIATAGRKFSGVDFRVGSGETMEFEDNSFDLVLFTMSLHHHTDCERALHEAYRTVTKDGRVVIIEPVADSEIQLLYRLFVDETPAIERASDAIETSDFEVERYEVFEKDWVFEDKEDLYGYHFENYGSTGYDVGIVDCMNRQLGDRIDAEPIIVKEDMRIFLMRKKDTKKEWHSKVLNHMMTGRIK